MNDQDPSTKLIHHPYHAPDGFDAPQTPVYKASTVYFANVAAMRARNWKSKAGYTYGLHGTPTTFVLEERIATLEGGLQTLLLPSGLAAIALVDMALLKAGDEVLIPDNAYGPGKALAGGELAGWGITHRLYDPMDLGSLARLIGAATKLVWLEAPGSVTMEFPDLRALLAAAKVRGVLTALDNTWGAGVAFNGFDLGDGHGADIVMQALTKYPSGGGDVLMGSVTTRDEALHLRLKLAHMRMGWGVGANDAELVLRSLPTIRMRYEAQDRAARALARALVGRAAGDRAGATPCAAGSAGSRALANVMQRGRRPVLDRLRRALWRAAGRCLRRRAEAVSHRLLLGRSGQPGRDLRFGAHAGPTCVARHGGALLDRLRGGGRSHRRLRAGARCARGLRIRLSS
jgi:cystathionine beta-lyase